MTGAVRAGPEPYAMPSWTTGGTDVICEREKQTRVERECVKDRRKKKKETQSEAGKAKGKEREKEWDGEEERCNEARLRG